MIEVTNECVGCPVELACLGDACPYMNVTRYYCDKCEEEIEDEDYYKEELCPDCYYEMYGVNINGEIQCHCCDEWFTEEKIIRTEDGEFCKECYEKEYWR